MAKHGIPALSTFPQRNCILRWPQHCSLEAIPIQRQKSTFTRLLRRKVHGRRSMPVETSIYKVTGKTASFLRIGSRAGAIVMLAKTIMATLSLTVTSPPLVLATLKSPAGHKKKRNAMGSTSESSGSLSKASDMSLQSSPSFLTYKTSDFLGGACHQNVNTNSDYSQVLAPHGPFLGSRTHFSGFK